MFLRLLYVGLHIFLFLETCKIKPDCLSHIALLPLFNALFLCSL